MLKVGKLYRVELDTYWTTAHNTRYSTKLLAGSLITYIGNNRAICSSGIIYNVCQDDVGKWIKEV